MRFRERVDASFVGRDRPVMLGAFVPQRRGQYTRVDDLWLNIGCCVRLDLGQRVV